jgi:hypothetical protein
MADANYYALCNPLCSVTECSLAPFLAGTTTQKIPFVFLPLKGQIVYPSAEINFSGKLRLMFYFSASSLQALQVGPNY